MKITIELGEVEKHRFEYEFNQLFGRLVIKVNEQPVRRAVRLFNEPILEVFAFVVGDKETHSVRIEKRRKQLFGHRSRVFVNNRLVRVVEA